MLERSFEQELRDKIHLTEEIITPYLPVSNGEDGHGPVTEAMAYSFLAGGKRLRPLIMHEVYQVMGGEGEEVEPFMAALEMIHTYSLIHDDLPAMDNDDYRRGKKTCHIVYGEDIAILAGDALLNGAFETAMKAFALTKEKDRVIAALQVLGNRAGIHGMIGGQTIDVSNEGKSISEEMLLTLYREKTGALLSASFSIGAILAGKTEEEVLMVSEAAYEIGLAFQIRDDILDLIGDQEKFGKPIHSDEKNNKTTYAILHGMEESQRKVKELTDSARKTLFAFCGEDSFLLRLLTWLIERDY